MVVWPHGFSIIERNIGVYLHSTIWTWECLIQKTVVHRWQMFIKTNILELRLEYKKHSTTKLVQGGPRKISCNKRTQDLQHVWKMWKHSVFSGEHYQSTKVSCLEVRPLISTIPWTMCTEKKKKLIASMI